MAKPIEKHFAAIWYWVLYGICTLTATSIVGLFVALPAWWVQLMATLAAMLFGVFAAGEYVAQALWGMATQGTMSGFAFVKVEQKEIRVAYAVWIVVVMFLWFPHLPLHLNYVIDGAFAAWLPWHYAHRDGPLLAVVKPLLRKIGWIV